MTGNISTAFLGIPLNGHGRQNGEWRQFASTRAMMPTPFANPGVDMNAPTERDRISARVSAAVAETLNQAADLQGTTLSSFVVQAALKEARRVIDREKTIYLSNADAALLLDLLDNPPPPNAAMNKAFERFMKAKYGAGNRLPGKKT